MLLASVEGKVTIISSLSLRNEDILKIFGVNLFSLLVHVFEIIVHKGGKHKNTEVFHHVNLKFGYVVL